MFKSWGIRPYAVSDRAAVRKICCDTADAGRPVEAFCDDRELIGDLLMNYYTEFEPASAWVVEQFGEEPSTGEVAGYLAGCCDTSRFKRIMFWWIVPKALFKAFWRGTWCSAALWRLIRWNLMPCLRRLGHRAMPLAEYPAHLHINLQADMHGQGVGRRLVNQFLGKLRAAAVSGVHVSTREDNISALGFFEKIGFVRLGRQPFLQLGPGRGNMRYSTIMIQSLK